MKQTVRQLLYILLIMNIFSSLINASEIEYQDKASELILASLKEQPRYSFLTKLYKELFFAPAWMNETKLSSAANEFFEHIKNDITLDKKGKLYQNMLAIKKEASVVYLKNGNIKDKVSLEFRASQLYEAYTNYAYLGGINWGAFNARISNLMVNDVHTEWVLHRPKINSIAILEKAVTGASLSKLLEKSTPSQYKYKALQKELLKYRKIKQNGGWPKVSIKGKLVVGSAHKGVESLRERLRITGDYTPCGDKKEGLTYNKCLEDAVKNFQNRNGLTIDGLVAANTLRALNKSIDNRITTILLNLDRIKWLRSTTYKRHIVINIPDFTLSYQESGKLKQRMRTVVGRPKNPTPIFSNIVKTIVLNPYWNLPTSIIQKEMIPKLLKNPKSLEKKDIFVYDSWKKDAKIVDPGTVDWSKYIHTKRVPYRFAQSPGKHNALGKVKFLFPNKYAVYMHDTPAKSLFRRSKRAFSHGCIRLHEPRELLKTFASFNQNVDFNKSQTILKDKEKTHMALKEQVPIDVVYLTAWVDFDGSLQFRNDIYGYDSMQLKSFRRW